MTIDEMKWRANRDRDGSNRHPYMTIGFCQFHTCVVCDICGYCITCFDCERFGCGPDQVELTLMKNLPQLPINTT